MNVLIVWFAWTGGKIKGYRGVTRVGFERVNGLCGKSQGQSEASGPLIKPPVIGNLPPGYLQFASQYQEIAISRVLDPDTITLMVKSTEKVGGLRKNGY